MGVCNRGKCFIYVSNYDGVKNQTGSTDHPYAPNTNNTNMSSAGGPFYRGSNYIDSKNASFYLTMKNIYLLLMSSNTDFDPTKIGYNNDPGSYSNADYASIISSSYNITEEKISYQNPIILHITTTYKKLNSDDKPIYGIVLYGTPTNFENNNCSFSGYPILLAYEKFDEPININKDDTITFTMIIK